jgi:hypothetical protein
VCAAALREPPSGAIVRPRGPPPHR